MHEGKTDKTEKINRQIQIIVGDFNTPLSIINRKTM